MVSVPMLDSTEFDLCGGCPSTELDLWTGGRTCGGMGLIFGAPPPPPSREYPRADDDLPAALPTGGGVTGTSATGPVPCLHFAPSACLHRSRMHRISTSRTGADAGARL